MKRTKKRLTCITYTYEKNAVDNEDSKIPHENMPLPRFRSYYKVSNADPIVKKYTIERNKIKKLLKGKNFEKEVLRTLYATTYKNRESTIPKAVKGF